jgi:arsenate reductase
VSADDTTPDRKKVVLFLCTHNSARSQMAEAFLREYAGDRFEALSAGLEPTEVHPLAVRVMREVGIDIAGSPSKSVLEYLGRRTVHVAVFLCPAAEEACPTNWPWALGRLSWPFNDPAATGGTEEERLRAFREVRDKIERRIRDWLGDGGAA